MMLLNIETRITSFSPCCFARKAEITIPTAKDPTTRCEHLSEKGGVEMTPPPLFKNRIYAYLLDLRLAYGVILDEIL